MGAWRRADRALEALQQPHGWDAQHRAGEHDGAAPSKSMENRRCKCTCILRRSMIFAPHSKLVLTRNLKTILVDLLADPRPGIGARHSRTPPVARNGRRVTRRSPPLEKLGEQPASRGAAPRNARESGGRSRRRARASSTAGATLAASHRSGRVGQLSVLSGPGAAKEHSRHRRVATQSRNAQHSARDKWLPRRTPPT